VDDLGLGRRVSAFADVSTLPAQRIWDGVVGRVVHGEKLTLAVVELEPGSVVPEHRHANEQVGLCVAGSLRFRVSDETREIAPGCTWCILAETPHEVAAGPEGAIVIETFAPVRADWEALERVEGQLAWPQ
jgi:quercetin dioxygenase-like cupin family protein